MKKISKITFILNTDDIKDHRYASGDDWWDPTEVKNVHTGKKELVFKTVTADFGNIDYNFLVLIHAVIEQYLCFREGISDKDVTKFDTSEGKNLIDPGTSKKSPYHFQHKIATQIERILSVALTVPWPEYNKQYDKVVSKWKKK